MALDNSEAFDSFLSDSSVDYTLYVQAIKIIVFVEFWTFLIVHWSNINYM